MRLPFPRRRTNQGIYGGFGSKASDKPWQPSAHNEPPEPDKVPKRFRRLRLRKPRWRASDEPIGPGLNIWCFLAVVAVFLVARAIARAAH